MNKMMHCRILCFTIFVVLYACAGIPLNDYYPRSPDEEEIIEVIIKHERAWNEQDILGFMTTYHNSVRIEDGCNGPLVSKNEFSDRIEQLMNEYPTVKFFNPKLNISENSAFVTVTSTRLGNHVHLFRLEMLKENDHWLIVKETCN